MMCEILWLNAEDDRWSETLARAAAYDTYHLAAYHSLAERMGEGTARLFVYHEGERFVALPLLIRSVEGVAGLEGENLKDATSVYGYPGPIISAIPPSSAMLERFRTSLTKLLIGQRIVTVFSRLNPLLDQAPLVEGLGDLVEHGLTVSIDLQVPTEQQHAGYRVNHRRDIKWLKGHGFVCAADPGLRHIDEFTTFYHKTMRRVNASEYYFFDAHYFQELTSGLCGHLDLVICRHGQELVAAALFLSTHHIVQYHLGGSGETWLRQAPMKLLFEFTREMFQARGEAVLHLGGGVGGAQDSLFTFKAGFSSRRHPFRTWRWVVLPEMYLRLCARRLQHLGATTLMDDGFFPLYRHGP